MDRQVKREYDRNRFARLTRAERNAINVRSRERNRLGMARRYAERRRKVDAIKVAKGCVECGYNKHPAALHFDHRDPTVKSFKIASALNRNWEDLLAEIEKCDVRCANCHAVRTVELQPERLERSPGRPRLLL